MISTTERVRISDLRAATKRLFRRACEDLAITFAQVGREIGDDRGTLVQRWASETSDHPLPVWALTDRHAIPDALFERIVADVRGLRASQPNALQRTSLGLGMTLLRVTGEAIAELANASADGRLDACERPTLRTRASAVIATAQAFVDALHADDARESGEHNVVAMPGAKR